MSSALKWSLWIAAALAAVLVASLLYQRSRIPSAPIAEDAAPPTEAIEMHPALRRGLKAAEEGRLNEARASFAQVPVDDPYYLLANKNRAAVEMRMGEIEDAERTLEGLTRLRPDDPELHARLAEVRFRLDRYRDAELSALRALEIDPGLEDQRYAVGLYRTAQEELAGATQIYERVMGTNPDRDRVMGALAQLIEFHDEHPDGEAIHYVLAFFAHKLGRDELEREELGHYMATVPSGPAVALAQRRLQELDRR